MSILSGLDESKTERVDGDYLKDGEYYLLLIDATLGVSRKDQDYGVTEWQVLEATPTDPAIMPNRAKSRAKVFYNFDRTRQGDLTDIGRMNMERFKSFNVELLGGEAAGIKPEQVTSLVILGIFEGTRLRVGDLLNDEGKPKDKQAAATLATLTKQVEEKYKVTGLSLQDFRGEVLRVDAKTRMTRPKDPAKQPKPITALTWQAVPTDKVAELLGTGQPQAAK